MIGHSLTASESWKNLPWKKFRRELFRLQNRVFKAIGVGDKRTARSLQKLILKSQAARLLAIRQVTQLNAGKKTAGVDGKKSLSFEERYTTKKLLDKAFPKISYAENRYSMVTGDKSPFDGDISYWSERNSKLYDSTTSKALKKQNHSCARCGYKLTSEEKVHLHHIDGNHHNWKPKNLEALHKSCHDYLHMSKPRG